MSRKSQPKKVKAGRAQPAPVPAVLSTRQLRRKEGSFKKISEMTQMLLTPITELTPKVRVRRSPKEKSAEKRDLEKTKSEVKKVKKQVLSEGRPPAPAQGRKRGAEREHPERGLGGARGEGPLSVRALIELAETRELADDDLAEILTCDSPVWWEDPPDASYCEEPICLSTLFADHCEEMTNRDDLHSVSISVQDTKHIDYKFMKKRLKLEHLLGNIKTRIHNRRSPSATCKTSSFISETSEISVKQNEDEIDTVDIITVDNNKSDKETVAAEEIGTEVKRVKKTSESTEGDSILGLNNEDLLRDLENMDIPMETDRNAVADMKAERNLDNNIMEVVSNNSQDVDLNLDEASNEISVTNFDNIIITNTMSMSSVSTLSQNDDRKVETEEKSSITSLEKVLASQEHVSDAVSMISNTASYTVSDTIHSSSPMNILDTPNNDLQETDSQNSIDHEIDEIVESVSAVDGKVGGKTPLDKNGNSGEDGIIIEESPTKVTNNENSSPENSQNDNLNANLQDDVITEKYRIEVTDKEPSENCHENYKSSEKDDVSNEGSDDDATKNDTSIKATIYNKVNKLNKEQLMAVYKTMIIDTGYAQNLNETPKPETANPSPVDQNLENVATFYKKCKNVKRATKIETTNDEATNNNIDRMDIEAHTEEGNSDDKNKCCNCNKNSEERKIEFSIIPDGKSAKYCLKCSSIFETETCCYCEKKLQSEAPCHSCKV